MGNPVFEQCDEITEIIQSFKEKRPELFGDLFNFIDEKMFVCGMRTDKDCPKKQKWTIKIRGIRGPNTLMTPRKYLIYGYSNRWEALKEEKKIAHVAYVLRQIDYPTEDELIALEEKGEEYEYGKLVKPDLEDFKSFSENLGVNWKEDWCDVPNLLTSDIEV